jgi:hypothetical protein
MSIPPISYVSSDQSMVTSGVESFSSQATPIVSGGLPTDASPAPAVPNASETPSIYTDPTQPGMVLGSDGNYYPASSVSAGGGITGPPISAFNPINSALKSSSLPANNPAQQPNLNPGNGLYHEASYTGSNLKVMIEVANDGTNTTNPTGLSTTTNSNNVSQQGISKPARQAKQLVELTTITVSVHRVKSPAVACGYINAKGWARGRRTIAGTLVMTKFTTDVLYSFLNSGAFTSDLSKDTTYMKVDQLPPFNLTLLFADEYGNSSSQRLLGVELVTSGDVYSIQDMLSEQTVSYVAADFTPLMPLNKSSLYGAATGSTVTAPQRTVGTVLNQQAAQ